MDYAGKEILKIESISQVKEADPNKCMIVISSRLGLKKKVTLLEELEKNKFTVRNSKHIKAMDEKRKLAEEAKKKKQSKDTKAKEKKSSKKKEEKEESIEDMITDEDKKKIEKQEIDRLLTKKF